MPSPSRSRLAKIASAAAVFAVIAVLVLRPWHKQPLRAPASHKGTSTTKQTTPTTPDPQLGPSHKTGTDEIRAAARALESAKTPDSEKAALARLRSQLSSLPPESASAIIRTFLDSKVDAPTRLEFKVGPDGFLTQPSSLRVYLLDQLARVDRVAAGVYGGRILASLDSPDEWAVALRNFALVNSTAEGRAFLREKLQMMLRHEPWQANPSVGFLEAFDVAVFAGGGEVVGLLTDLVRQKENRAVAHAAYLALDRLTLRDGATVLAQLASQHELMEGREATRANYFARAQVSDPAQRAVLESYLLNPNIGEAELATFAGIYPNANFMISHNLLTRVETPDGATLARQDREALQTIESWLADPRFARIKPQLETIRQRLRNFVVPAQQGTGSK